MYRNDHRRSLGTAPTYRGATEARRTSQLNDTDHRPPPDTPRVFLVDDSDQLRSSVRGLLEETGIHIAGEAGDAATALRLIPPTTHSAPLVVLVDVHMPGELNGIDLTRALTTSGANLEVVVFTAFPDLSIRQAARDAGAVAFLLKGCSATEVLRTIQVAWEAARLWS